MKPEALYGNANPLAPFYGRFRVHERILLTGHSHQAWPDCAFDGQQEAWLDAAEHADEKWERAFAKADRVRRGFARLLQDHEGHVTLASNTHELLIRFMSALPLRTRPRLLTTDGEFHTLRRQLDRLAEEGLEVVKVAARPAGTVVERLISRLDDRTAAVFVSSVFFQSGHIVPSLKDLAAECERRGALLMVDAYHSLNVVPFSIREQGLEQAFVVGGGYKYCQLGEGNCFLRFPRACMLRPVITGWFSEFAALSETVKGRVAYGEGPARFAGSTYDPTSHYRAARVFDFFDEQGLNPALLRQVSQHQVGLLARAFDGLDLDPEIITRDRTVPLEGMGGFLVLFSSRAETFCSLLRRLGVHTDYRGDALRLGPAPYLSDHQLATAMARLGETVKG
jgi:kynureninase